MDVVKRDKGKVLDVLKTESDLSFMKIQTKTRMKTWEIKYILSVLVEEKEVEIDYVGNTFTKIWRIAQ